MLKVAEHYLEGHPDKVCDQIADAILDEFVRRDEKTRARILVFGGHGALMISGEVMSKADFDCAEIAKKVYRDIGYEDEVEPFVHLGPPPLAWQENISKNAPTDLALCTGFATKATREFLAPANVFANLLAEKIDEARRHDVTMSWLKPDGSVWVATDGNRVSEVGISCQHAEGALVQQVYGGVLDRIIRPVIGNVDGVKLFVNSGGLFVEGGFQKTVGQSGSAVVSDLYGGLLPLGTGGLSGKDGAHPFRAGTYMARHIAKSLVASGASLQVFVKILYVPGRVDPVLFEVLGDSGLNLTEVAKKNFDLHIEAIVERFGLRKPIFRRYSASGPIGKIGAPWEEVSMIS